MSISLKEAIQLILPRGLYACKDMLKLSHPLKTIGIDILSYSVFRNFKDNRTIRLSTYSSDEDLIHYYLEHLNAVPEDALLENQKIPLNKNSLLCPYNPAYFNNNSVRQLENKYGIKNAISLSFHNVSTNITELFWFQTFDDRREWNMQLMQNLNLLNQFVIFFRDQIYQKIKPSQLAENEILKLYGTSLQKPIDNDRIPSNTVNFNISKYHFGHPFIKPLTKKEFIILKLTFLGYSAKQISEELGLSDRTIQKQQEIILAKTVCISFKTLRQELFKCALFCNAVLPNLS